jgi:hypothetical protein
MSLSEKVGVSAMQAYARQAKDSTLITQATELAFYTLVKVSGSLRIRHLAGSPPLQVHNVSRTNE